MTRTEKLLAELIALPSVNPGFAPVDGAAARPIRRAGFGEKNVADFLAAKAAQAGLEIEFQKVLPGRSNLLARLLPKGKSSRPFCSRRIWTPWARTTRNLFRGGKTAGCMAAAPATPKVPWPRCSPRCANWRNPLRVPRPRRLCSRAWWTRNTRRPVRGRWPPAVSQADLAIVGEPTRLRVVTAHKGSLWLRLETRGKAAHGATPQLGQNAIHEMARVVDLLESDYAAQLRRRTHPLLGTATVNVGQISGGTQPNIVPAACAITVDRRTLPGETDAGVCREIAARLRQEQFAGENFAVPSSPPPRPWKPAPAAAGPAIFRDASARRDRRAWIIFATRRCCRRPAFRPWCSGRATLRRRTRRTNGFRWRNSNARKTCC